MKKRFISLMMVCILLMGCMAGCGNDKNQTATAGNASETGSAAAQTTAPKVTEMSKNGEYPVVTMAYVNFTGAPNGLDRIEKLMSAYTEEKLGISLDLMVFDTANYAQQLQLMLTSGEKLDIYNALILGYSACVNNGYTLNLEENDLLQTYGSGILETMNEAYIEGCRINGVLYGLPQQREYASGVLGVIIPNQYLDTIGYDYAAAESKQDPGLLMSEDILYTDMETINDIFAKLHEAYPDKYVFGPQQVLSHAIEVDNVGGDYFGVLFDDAADLTLENFYESQEFYDYCKMVYDWNQAGYISKDALTDTTAVATQVMAGQTMAFISSTKPGFKTAEVLQLGMECTVFQAGGFYAASSSPASMPWCINSSTENPAAAMQILNALYTDAYLSNLLIWGEENVDYVVQEDGKINYPEGLDASTVDYYSGVNWELPNQFIAHVWHTDSSDIWEQYQRLNSEAVQSPAMGFNFDNSSVSTEYAALTNLWSEYSKQLMYGFLDPDIGIPELVEKMEAAGLQKYMDEKQKQLNEWSKNR